MSIADKITSITGHLEDDYTALEQLGVSVEDRNIENIKNMANQIYAKFPKTDYAEGSNITLSNTLKGKLDFEDDIVGYGDTKQDSTQGYNLLPCRGSGVRFEYVNNYYQNTALEGYFLQDGITLSANTTYYFKLKLLSKPTSATTLNGYFNGTVDNSFSFTNINSLNLNEVYTKTHTPTSEETLIIRAWGNSNNDTYKFQLWITTDNSKDTFEPYTNGASPNPSYPQDIEVVRGKNRFDGELLPNSYNPTTGEIEASSTSYRSNKISLQKNETYYLSGITGNVRVLYWNNTSYVSSEVITMPNSFITKGNIIAFQFDKSLSHENIMIEKGSQATSYLPYNTVEVVKRGKNYWGGGTYTNGTLFKTNENGTVDVALSNQEGTSAVTTQAVQAGIVKTLKAGTYTFSAIGLDNGYLAAHIVKVNSATSGQVIQNLTNVTTSKTFTITEDINYFVRVQAVQSITFTGTIYLQIESGDTATTYEPYITPQTYQLSLGEYEFAKIGNYVDTIEYDVDEDKVYKNGAIGKVDLATQIFQDWNNNLAVCTTIPNIKYTSSNTEIGFGLAENYKIHQGSGMNSSSAYGCIAIDVSQVSVNPSNSTKAISGLFYYALATPTKTEITGTLKDQIKALYNLQSFTGTTIIEIDGQLPLIIKVRALKGE